MKSTLFKNVTALVAIIGIIGGIVSGNVFKAIDFDNLISLNGLNNGLNTKFNFGLMISCWVGTALLCLIFYGFACILEHLEKLDDNSFKLVQQKNELDKKEKPATAAIPTKPIKKTEQSLNPGDWICPECGRVNGKYVGTCGCGHVK